jgi:hypothetical protein
MPTVNFRIRRKGSGWQGIVELPVGTALIPVTATSKSKRKALAKAAGLAGKIAESPILKAVLPPGSAAAIKATRLIAKYAKAGKLAKAMKKLTGKGAKRLLKKLKFW